MRDIDLLAQLAELGATRVFVSVPIGDAELCQLLEPRTAAPRHRFRAIERLAAAGIPVGPSIALLIPGLTDPTFRSY